MFNYLQAIFHQTQILAMDIAKVKKLHEWLHQNSGSLQKGVEIAYSPSYGYHLQTHLTGFEAANPVVHVPQSLTLSISTLSYAQSQWPPEFVSHCADKAYVITRFLLLDEYLHDSSSWWHPYISLLPQISDDPESQTLNTPLWFSPADLTWLEGTGLPAAVEQRIKSWRTEYDEGRKFLTGFAKYGDYSW